MKRPSNVHQPFFAYGIFKPGELAFFQIREFVSEVNESAQVKGAVLLRDGLPILDPDGRGYVKGALLTFRPESAGEAYDRISAMEPQKQYVWNSSPVFGASANVLLGRSPKKGSVQCEDEEWDSWKDPLLTTALDVVAEALQRNCEFDWNLKPLFGLQMAYLLLWSSIERYTSLRYHLGDKVTEKVCELAGEPAFAEGLRRHVKSRRKVHRADRPSVREVLDPDRPDKSLGYYYQLRSNITHRGKGVVCDHNNLRSSLEELLAIFGEVLEEARCAAGWEG